MKNKPTRGTGDQGRQNLPDDPEQARRFKEDVRLLGLEDESEKFEKALGLISTEVRPPDKSVKKK